jgi:hypothetical protein
MLGNTFDRAIFASGIPTFQNQKKAFTFLNRVALEFD